MKEKGITLIALVITIIVLLILAGVSIAMLTGDNGILTQATRAKDMTTEETEKEEIKLAYNAAKSKKYEEGDYTGGISASDFEDELKKQEPKVEVKENSGTIEVTFPSGNVYTVESNGNITGSTSTPTTPSVEGKLATEVLKVNPDAGEEAQDYERSPYVEYNGILCRAFYNDEYENGKHGLQIISADNIKVDGIEEKVTLGESGNFDKSKDDYNNAVDILNNKAKSYMSEEDKEETTVNKIAIDARSLGSIATLNAEGKFNGDPTIETAYTNNYEYFSTFNNKFKVSDENYKEDADSIPETLGQLQKLGLYSVSGTYLASRNVDAYPTSVDFRIRYTFETGYVSDDDVCYVDAKKEPEGYWGDGRRHCIFVWHSTCFPFIS